MNTYATNPAPAGAHVPATERQKWFATELGRECNDLVEDGYSSGTNLADRLNDCRETWRSAVHDKDAMSGLIDKMITIRTELRDNRTRQSRAKMASIAEGMWIVGNMDTTEHRIFKVQSANGRLKVKELIEGKFRYAPGGMRLLATQGRALTLEEAKKYGAIYGWCCVCGALLTNEDSIQAGIGPICAKRF